MDDCLKVEFWPDGDPIEGIMDLCDKDTINKIEPLMHAVADKIKQLTRELAQTGSKKLKLMKQFEALSILEEKIQQQLKDEMNNEKKLQELMTERIEKLKTSNSNPLDEKSLDENLTVFEELDTEVTKLENSTSVETLLDMRCTANNDYPSSTEYDLEEDKRLIQLVDPDMENVTSIKEVTSVVKKGLTRRSYRKKELANKLRKKKQCEKSKDSTPPLGIYKYKFDRAKLGNGRRIVNCPQCNKEFKRRDHLENHILRQCKDKTFDCHECDKKFKFSGSLRLHARCHSDDPVPRYQCPKCIKCLTTLHAFKRHLRMHEKDFSHLCPACGRGFVDKVALKAHMVSHDNPQYKCEECGKPFLHERFLRCHLRLHRGECDHVCAMCGKAFTTAAVLRTHMKVHDTVKEHVCTVCGHAFTYVHSLQNHMRIHTGEKAFGCVECSVKFHTRFQFERHQREMHGVIPRVLHICKECGKECSSMTNLTTHMTSHSAEKPHRCDQCDNSYKTKYDLTKHKKKLHSGAVNEGVIPPGILNVLNNYVY